jgi:glycosyltransferase involved in cell wall biosynthesis
VVADQAAIFSAQGHDVTVIAGNLFNEAGNGRIASVVIPDISPTALPIVTALEELRANSRSSIFAAARAGLEDQLCIALRDCDAVLVHNVCTMPFNLPLTAALAGLPALLPQVRFIAWIHDIAAINPDYSILPGNPWDFLRQSVPGYEYVAVSERRQTEWRSLTGCAVADCVVIPNGFSPERELQMSAFASRLVDQGILERDLVLLHPCRLLRRKNVEKSLRITAALRNRGTDAVLLITGAGDPHQAESSAYAAEVRQIRDNLQLAEAARFLGGAGVLESDLPSLYLLSDALLLPSRQEGFGLPMLEAAFHRIPAFCSDIEPLNRLPGAIPFSLDAHPDEIASLIIHHMQQWPANSPRKAVIRNHTWSAVYRNYLDPLLGATNNHP